MNWLSICLLLVASLSNVWAQPSRTAPVTPDTADVQQIWASTFGGLRSGTGTSVLLGSAIDPNDGSIVAAGRATGTYLGHTPVTGTDLDAFLVKMTPEGGLVWVRWFATVLADSLQAVAIDLNGNIYATGSTEGTFPNSTKIGSADMFVVSLNANGDQRWLRQYGISSVDWGFDIGVDVFGFCYIAWGGTNNAYLTKLSSDGNTIFTFTYATSSLSFYQSSLLEGQRGLTVVNPIQGISNTSAVVLAFMTTNAALYDYATFTHSGTSGEDLIVARVSSVTGQPEWSRIYQTTTSDLLGGVRADANGSIYLTGMVRAGMEGNGYAGNGNNYNIFLSKLAFDGTKLWTVQYGAGLSSVYPNALVVDNAGGVYVAGINEQLSAAYPMVDGLPPLFGVVSSFLAYPTIVSKFDNDGFRLWTTALSTYTPARTTSVYPAFRSRSLAYDSVTGILYVLGDKNGLYTGDVDSTPRFADSEINLYQAVIAGLQQPPSNITLAQIEVVLDQLRTLIDV